MRRAAVTFRLLVAAGLIAGLGFNRICRCPDILRTADSAERCEHHPTRCPCGAPSDCCCLAKPCKCEGERPAAAVVKAASNPAVDPSHAVALAIAQVAIGSPAAALHRFEAWHACLYGSTTNLVAQGTRLNI